MANFPSLDQHSGTALEKRERASDISRSELLAEVGTILAAEGELTEKLKSVADSMVPALADQCLISVMANESAIHCATDAKNAPPRENHDFELISETVEQGPAVLMSYAGEVEQLRSFDVSSALISPIHSAGWKPGFIALLSATPARYGERDLVFLSDISSRIAVVVENWNLTRQLQEVRAELHRTQQTLSHALHRHTGTAASLLTAEKALRESEERFHSLADFAPFSIFIHDGKKFLYLNPASSEITGYSREELMRMELWDLIHPHSIPLLRDRFRKRAGGKLIPPRFEAKILTKEGAEKWIYFSSGELKYQGRPAVISGAIDITEQRRGDEELRSTQERTRLASESAGISSWQWDIRADKVTVSLELHRIFGLNESLCTGRLEEFLSCLHEEDQARVRQSIERSVTGHKDFDVEFRLKRGDGGWAWTHTRGKVFYDALKHPERMIAVTIDVTAGKLAIQALHESEQRFRASFHHLAIGMIQLALDGTILLVNQRFCDIVGYRDYEVAGRRLHDLTHPDDLELSLQKLLSMLSGEIASYTIEQRCIHKDGSYPWVQVTASLVKDPDGNPKYIIAAVEDITERRRSAEALRNSEKLAATGRLAASIAHEINNPLESVTNLLYLLERNSSLNESGKSYARMAQEELNRVAHIARQTLGFYRDSAQREPIQLPALMDGVLELFARKIRNAEVEVKKEYRIVGVIDAYPGEIRQVLSNLIANALDAIGKHGKISIRISRSRSWVPRGHRGVRLTIADSGSGISIANRKRLFEPFFTTKGAKGTGLGLWVTRGMVEKHGGTIRMRSRLIPGNSGTAFSIFLPLKQKSETARRKQARIS